MIDYFIFECVITEVNHLVNKRVVAFKEKLRDDTDCNLNAITPEVLIHGYELPSANLVPNFQPEDRTDPDFNPSDKIKERFQKIQKVRENLLKLYQDEFLANLTRQATDQKDRFKPIKHIKLKENDIVLLRENFIKPHNYPMGKVVKVVENKLGEVTNVEILKGVSRETVKRHVSSLIPLIIGENLDPSPPVDSPPDPNVDLVSKSEPNARPKRNTALKARGKIKGWSVHL